jgi:hypothetical protein
VVTRADLAVVSLSILAIVVASACLATGAARPGGIIEAEALEPVDRLGLWPKKPLGLLEVDTYGNLLLPTVADATVTFDGAGEGEPEVSGTDIHGSRCARSVFDVMERTDGPFTVVCLPREYGLYERIHGRPAPAEGEAVEPEE